MPLRLFPLLILLAWLPLPAAATDEALTLGVFPRRAAAETREMFQPIADYLARQLGREVSLEVPTDFPSFWQRVKQGQFDLVHYNQYHYIRAHRLFGHNAILMNEEHGSTSLRAAIIVPADSRLRKIEQLRGRKIVFGGGRGAMVSHIMARDLLRSAGLRDGDYISDFALNPIAAATSLYYRQADASSGSDTILKMRDMPWHQRGQIPRVLAISEPVAQLPWAVAADVDPTLARRIAATLLQLNDNARGRLLLERAGLSGLHPASDDDYQPHRAIVARALDERY